MFGFTASLFSMSNPASISATKKPDRVVGGGGFTLLPDHSEARFYKTLPLPGVIILVHGVNSDGEWYDSTEEGLCEGLNDRLARQPEQMAFSGPTSGRLMAAKYTPELTSGGFLAPMRSASNFLAPQPYWSPVIRFRWGYKASKEELTEYGANVWLNEQDYWGGGPFANGCSAVADLWSEGLNDRLFLWLTAQHLNPVPGRDVYTCPHRAYYVHAALRLARLIKSIRERQQDCPVTVMCHSQGNMVGLAAAFLADRLGVQADSYLLCNPPLSLVPDNMMESWVQRGSRDARGAAGRQSSAARTETLKSFFTLLRQRAAAAHPDDRIDKEMANAAPRQGQPFTSADDRQRHGLNGNTFGRVTLYCNPHDQVISASTVQGIGWRGMSQEEIQATQGEGVFAQRVFAHGYAVGQAPGQSYRYWEDRWNKDAGAGKDGFWHPPSPSARYSIRQGLTSNQGIIGKIATALSTPFLAPVALLKASVNADAPKHWSIPVNAPALPNPFLPRAYRYGQQMDGFDEGLDPSGNARDVAKREEQKRPDDPYDQHPTRTSQDGSATDAPMGDASSEAQLRYEDRARLRMQARRTGLAGADGQVIGEDKPDEASDSYRQWRNQQVSQFLVDGVDQNATDHSTIVTNPEHARRAAAYDVAVGVCTLSEKDLRELRVEADWRYSFKLPDSHPHKNLSQYFMMGNMNGQPLHEWIRFGEAVRPDTVIDQRDWAPSALRGEP
nr:DUF3274 domain-containing protein [Herbaspirillum seropedicae]